MSIFFSVLLNHIDMKFNSLIQYNIFLEGGYGLFLAIYDTYYMNFYSLYRFSYFDLLIHFLLIFKQNWSSIWIGLKCIYQLLLNTCSVELRKEICEIEHMIVIILKPKETEIIILCIILWNRAHSWLNKNKIIRLSLLNRAYDGHELKIWRI